MRNKFVHADTNQEWHADTTLLDISIKGKPNSRHVLLIAIDPCVNMIMLCQAHYVKDSKGQPSSKWCAKKLEEALKIHKVNQPLLLHTDRGGIFMSDIWVQTCNANPFVQRSATKGGSPQENSICENMIGTFKKRLMDRVKKTNAVGRDTNQLNRIITREQHNYNLNSPVTKNLKLPPFEAKMRLEQSDIDLPTKTKALRGHPLRENVEARIIDRNREERLRDSDVQFSRTEVVEQYALIEKEQKDLNLSQTTYNVQNLQENMWKLKEGNKRIERLVTPKNKKKHKAIPQRDTLPHSVFMEIIKTDKPKNSNQKNWSRFLLTTAILFFSGMRVNQVALFTIPQIEEIIQTQRIQIYQPKVEQYRAVVFIDEAIPIIDTAKRCKLHP